MKKIFAFTLLAFLLALGGMAFSQQQGGMMAPQGGMMNMMGHRPMMGMMNMMSQRAPMMGGQQQMGQMFNQCMSMMGGQSATPGSQPQEKSGQSGELR